MGLLCARKCAGHRQSTGEPHALVQLGSKAFVKPPFQEVVQVRSNGYVQGLLDVAKYQRAGINLGNMPISRGLMQRREREKGIVFLLPSFGTNGNMKGDVSLIHQQLNLAPNVRHSLPTPFQLPGELPAPYDSPTSWKRHIGLLRTVPPGLETPFLSSFPSPTLTTVLAQKHTLLCTVMSLISCFMVCPRETTEPLRVKILFYTVSFRSHRVPCAELAHWKCTATNKTVTIC